MAANEEFSDPTGENFGHRTVPFCCSWAIPRPSNLHWPRCGTRNSCDGEEGRLAANPFVLEAKRRVLGLTEGCYSAENRKMHRHVDLLFPGFEDRFIDAAEDLADRTAGRKIAPGSVVPGSRATIGGRP
jgi:hypothetical protein